MVKHILHSTTVLKRVNVSCSRLFFSLLLQLEGLLALEMTSCAHTLCGLDSACFEYSKRNTSLNLNVCLLEVSISHCSPLVYILGL